MNAHTMPPDVEPCFRQPTAKSVRVHLILSAILGACIVTITWATINFTHPAPSFRCATFSVAEATP
jgi:hypothetical protein